MKTIAASILVLMSAFYVSAQQATDNLIEKRVPLTEAAVAFDASGAPALEATLRTTSSPVVAATTTSSAATTTTSSTATRVTTSSTASTTAARTS